MDALPPHELLLPRPKRLRLDSGTAQIGRAVRVRAPGGAATDRADRALARALAPLDLQRTDAASAFSIDLELDPHALRGAPELAGPEAYRLSITERRAHLAAPTIAGLAHAATTLGQWLEVHASAHPGGDLRAPAVLIEDAPDFPDRGFCLDVSRDRVPRMAELFALVERMERWKLNQLQLYTEHTFAYPGHSRVWGAAGAYAPDTLRALDGWCREHGVELVPNQNCFGHLHRWLKHAPYRDLAECPDGIDHPFLHPDDRTRGALEPWSLCPTDPRSLAFVAELLDALLPCFTSRRVHVGCDETIDLGQGRSRAACAERGTHSVYSEFVHGVDALVRERDHRALVWADVALQDPVAVSGLPKDAVAIAGLPKDAVAIIWGYEADHPFERQCAQLAASGTEFWVAPGTSSWNSLLGRTDNALANLRNAARIGRAAGATGYLVTDWGDYGHWQPAPVSWPGLAAGAALGWNADDDWTGQLAVRLAPHLVGGGAAGAALARALAALGGVASAGGPTPHNAAAAFLFLHHAGAPRDHERLAGFDGAGLTAERDALAAARSLLGDVPKGCTDAELAVRELQWAARLADLGLELGLARTAESGVAHAALRASISERVRAVARDLEPLWLARSRRAGLADSTARLDAVARAILPAR